MACKTLSELEDHWREFDVIGIDEGQFFDDVSKNSKCICIIKNTNKRKKFVGSEI